MKYLHYSIGKKIIEIINTFSVVNFERITSSVFAEKRSLSYARSIIIMQSSDTRGTTVTSNNQKSDLFSLVSLRLLCNYFFLDMSRYFLIRIKLNQNKSSLVICFRVYYHIKVYKMRLETKVNAIL